MKENDPVLRVIKQLINPPFNDTEIVYEPSIKYLRPIDKVSVYEGEAEKNGNDFTIWEKVSDEIPFDYSHFVLRIKSKDFYQYYIEMDNEDFIKWFNTIIYCYIREKKKYYDLTDTWTKTSVWFLPFQAFEDWLTSKSINPDLISMPPDFIGSRVKLPKLGYDLIKALIKMGTTKHNDLVLELDKVGIKKSYRDSLTRIFRKEPAKSFLREEIVIDGGYWSLKNPETVLDKITK
ncbi:MAG: hypothetical protein HQ509_02470 [Candidatus Marinimicrobia bacterium]|nr:hypothetical protein [Candidatus Neomarinimicrobiota bacterium]